MNSDVEKILIDAGWFEGRKVDISKCLESFQEDKIQPTETSISFMKEYYNLKIKIIAKFKELQGHVITVDVNSHSCIDPEFLGEYNQHYDKTLITVAECSDYDMFILIDEDGKFYGVSDQFVAVIGNSFEEMIENMMYGIINTSEFIWDEIED